MHRSFPTSQPARRPSGKRGRWRLQEPRRVHGPAESQGVAAPGGPGGDLGGTLPCLCLASPKAAPQPPTLITTVEGFPANLLPSSHQAWSRSCNASLSVDTKERWKFPLSLPLMLGREVQVEVGRGGKVGVSNPLQVLWSQVPELGQL